MPNVAIGPHYEKFIQEQLESGRYSSASEVVRAGLRLLENYEGGVERWARTEGAARLAELRENPEIGIPADQVHAELQAHHRQRGGKAR